MFIEKNPVSLENKNQISLVYPNIIYSPLIAEISNFSTQFLDWWQLWLRIRHCLMFSGVKLWFLIPAICHLLFSETALPLAGFVWTLNKSQQATCFEHQTLVQLGTDYPAQLSPQSVYSGFNIPTEHPSLIFDLMSRVAINTEINNFT